MVARCTLFTELVCMLQVWEAVRPYIESYQEKAVEPPAAKLRIVDQHKNC